MTQEWRNQGQRGKRGPFRHPTITACPGQVSALRQFQTLGLRPLSVLGRLTAPKADLNQQSSAQSHFKAEHNGESGRTAALKANPLHSSSPQFSGLQQRAGAFQGIKKQEPFRELRIRAPPSTGLAPNASTINGLSELTRAALRPSPETPLKHWPESSRAEKRGPRPQCEKRLEGPNKRLPIPVPAHCAQKSQEPHRSDDSIRGLMKGSGF